MSDIVGLVVLVRLARNEAAMPATERTGVFDGLLWLWLACFW